MKIGRLIHEDPTISGSNIGLFLARQHHFSIFLTSYEARTSDPHDLTPPALGRRVGTIGPLDHLGLM